MAATRNRITSYPQAITSSNRVCSFRAYQRHQRNTMRMEKERSVNGAQRNALTAKVHNLSCNRVPRDSSLTETKNSCKQAQTGPPTKPPSRVFHRKTAFTEIWFVRAQHLQCIPSPSTEQNQRPSLQKAQQTTNETLRTAGFKYPHGRTLERASALFKRIFYPYFPLGSLSSLLISILRQ